jgi:addiction module RelB/DinJ family antitoxin
MHAQSLIQVRIDRPLKEDVSQILESVGLDISTAVRMFFLRCRAERGIPFPLSVTSAANKQVKIGLAKGKWTFPDDWEAQDKALDKELEADFYADPT